MDPAEILHGPAREALRKGLLAAFPRIQLEFDPAMQKWFPQSGLRGSRFLGHSGISDSQAEWLLKHKDKISEMDVLLERYTESMRPASGKPPAM